MTSYPSIVMLAVTCLMPSLHVGESVWSPDIRIHFLIACTFSATRLGATEMPQRSRPLVFKKRLLDEPCLRAQSVGAFCCPASCVLFRQLVRRFPFLFVHGRVLREADIYLQASVGLPQPHKLLSCILVGCRSKNLWVVIFGICTYRARAPACASPVPSSILRFVLPAVEISD